MQIIYIYRYINLKTDQFSPQMVCRVFLLQMFVSNYCQTIVKLFYSNSRIFKLLSKQLFRLLNYCQNNFVNFGTIAKTISQTIDDTLNGPLVTLHQKLLENIQIMGYFIYHIMFWEKRISTVQQFVFFLKLWSTAH